MKHDNTRNVFAHFITSREQKLKDFIHKVPLRTDFSNVGKKVMKMLQAHTMKSQVYQKLM